MQLVKLVIVKCKFVLVSMMNVMFWFNALIQCLFVSFAAASLAMVLQCHVRSFSVQQVSGLSWFLCAKLMLNLDSAGYRANALCFMMQVNSGCW